MRVVILGCILYYYESGCILVIIICFLLIGYRSVLFPAERDEHERSEFHRVSSFSEGRKRRAVILGKRSAALAVLCFILPPGQVICFQSSFVNPREEKDQIRSKEDEERLSLLQVRARPRARTTALPSGSARTDRAVDPLEL